MVKRASRNRRTLVRNLSEAELRVLKPASLIVHSRREKEVATTSELDDHAYVVIRGLVGLLHSSAGGRNVVLLVLEPGESFALPSGETGAELEGRLVALVDDTAVWRLPRRPLLRLLLSSAGSAQALAETLERLLRQVCDRLVREMTEPLDHRLVRALVLLAPYDPRGRVEASDDELAALTGSTRSEVNRALGRLRGRDLVAYPHPRHWIDIPDPAALESMLGEWGDVRKRT